MLMTVVKVLDNKHGTSEMKQKQLMQELSVLKKKVKEIELILQDKDVVLSGILSAIKVENGKVSLSADDLSLIAKKVDIFAKETLAMESKEVHIN